MDAIGVHDGGIDVLWRCDAGTVEVSVTCHKAYFCFGENKLEVAVMPPPFVVREMAREARKLVDELTN